MKICNTIYNCNINNWWEPILVTLLWIKMFVGDEHFENDYSPISAVLGLVITNILKIQIEFFQYYLV